MKQYMYGIDVGGTTVKCGLFLTDGMLVEKWEIPTVTGTDGAQILPDIAAAVQRKNQERGIAEAEISGLGIGIPGAVQRQRFVPVAVNLHWKEKAVADELEEALHIRVVVENDANIAALGEQWKGAGRGAESMMMVTLGTGIGGGIILDGKIVSGAHGSAGEIGHLVLEPTEPTACNCGNHGCVEQYASARGIASLAASFLEKSTEASCLRGAELNGKTVMDAYRAGDVLAGKIVEKFGDYLGRALAGYSCVLDPECFVIGGGLSKAGQPLLDVLEQNFRRYAFPTSRETRMVLAELGNDAGMYGAARLAIV